MADISHCWLTWQNGSDHIWKDFEESPVRAMGLTSSPMQRGWRGWGGGCIIKWGKAHLKVLEENQEVSFLKPPPFILHPLILRGKFCQDNKTSKCVTQWTISDETTAAWPRNGHCYPGNDGVTARSLDRCPGEMKRRSFQTPALSCSLEKENPIPHSKTKSIRSRQYLIWAPVHYAWIDFSIYSSAKRFTVRGTEWVRAQQDICLRGYLIMSAMAKLRNDVYPGR